MKFPRLFKKIRAACTPNNSDSNSNPNSSNSTSTPNSNINSNNPNPTSTNPNQKSKKKRPSPLKIYPDRTHEYATDGRDHTHDDDMRAFEYWHHKITRFNPHIFGGAMDGKRATLAYRHEYQRRMESYERRRSERRIEEAKEREVEEERERLEGEEGGNGKMGRKSRMKDLLPKRERERARAQAQDQTTAAATDADADAPPPAYGQDLKTETREYGFVADEKLHLG